MIAGEPLPARIASVADQFQERAVEALWQAGRRPSRSVRSILALIRSRPWCVIAVQSGPAPGPGTSSAASASCMLVVISRAGRTAERSHLC